MLPVEHVILSNLISNHEYVRRTLPFLKEEYFSDLVDRKIFKIIDDYIDKYHKPPTLVAMDVELGASNTFDETQYKTASDLLHELNTVPDDLQWAVDRTETFCKDKACELAVLESLDILSGKNKHKLDRGMIPKIMADAISVSFDTNVGHDYLEEFESRFAYYHEVPDKVPFDLATLNKATQGGAERKTLNVLNAGTGVGKSLVLCHLASSYLLAGYNVLYITLELSEKKISQRIDANLLDIKIEDLPIITKAGYDQRATRLKSKHLGKLIVKEYPTSCAGPAHFRHLIHELEVKKGFKPDVVIVDYINLCISSRLKQSSYSDTYTYIKAIAEELRGLFVEFNVVGWSATQLNRTGFTDSDPGMEHTAESFGLPATCDFMAVLVQTEELQRLHQIMFKQLKSRYDDFTKMERFVIGVEKSKMRIYDVESSAQTLVQPAEANTPVFDSSEMGDRLKFEGFK